MLEKNPETVKIVFKHFPLRFHKQAMPAAMASMAAHAQGKFWEFHDNLFTLKSKDFNPEKYQEFAKKLFLDMDRFKLDSISQKTREKILGDMRDARPAGVTSTPSIFINGWRYRGKRTPEKIQEKINEELAKINGAGK